MTSFTSRYGNPAMDHKGAHLWAYRRHGATVVAVRGRVDAGNIDAVTAYAARFVAADTRIVVDLTEVTSFTPRAMRLLDTIDQRCADAGVDWVVVPGDAAGRRMRARTDWSGLPILNSLAEAEHLFDEAILKRRSFLLPLLRQTA